MTSFQLTQRLIHLKGTIADSVESISPLKEIDQLIIFVKHLHLHEKDEVIDSLKIDLRKATDQLKAIAQSTASLEEIIYNQKADLQIATSKCSRLEDKLKEWGRSDARQKRIECKKNRIVTAEFEVQVETVSHELNDYLTRCYKREVESNDRLREQILELKREQKIEAMSLSLAQTDISQIDSDKSCAFNSASFQEAITNTTPQTTQGENMDDDVKDQPSVLDLFWTKSKQILAYLKDQ